MRVDFSPVAGWIGDRKEFRESGGGRAIGERQGNWNGRR
jgi:hypothetical protein